MSDIKHPHPRLFLSRYSSLTHSFFPALHPQRPTGVWTSPTHIPPSPRKSKLLLPRKVSQGRRARWGEVWAQPALESRRPFQVQAAGLSQVFQDTLASDLYRSSLVSTSKQQVIERRPDGAPGTGMRAEGARGPQILLGDRPDHGKDSHPSPVTVTSVRAPDSWRPKSISRSVLCWGRVSWDPRGAVFATIAQLRVSLAFSLPHQGFPGSLPFRGPGCASGSWDGKESSAGPTLYSPSPGGEERRRSGLFPQLRLPPANFP